MITLTVLTNGNDTYTDETYTAEEVTGLAQRMLAGDQQAILLDDPMGAVHIIPMRSVKAISFTDVPPTSQWTRA
jgi:hypothetical protein